MEFEDILLEVGGKGKYQKRMILCFLLPSALLLPLFTEILFMLSVPDHWCNVPEVVQSNWTIEQQRKLISPPSDPKCSMYDINYTDYLNSGIYTVENDTKTKKCSYGWQFDKTNYDATAATKWNIVCEDAHYKNFVMTFMFVGGIIGTPIYGALADRFGRKITFYITVVITVVSTVTSVSMSDFTAFVIIRTFNGSLMPSAFQLPYIIVLELVAPEMRTHMNGLVNTAWTAGSCLIPLIAYLTRNWVTLGLVSASTALFFFVYWPFLPESPRWLLSRERYDEAFVILKKIGEINGKTPNEEQLMAKLKMVGEKIRREKTVDKVQNSLMDFLRYPRLRMIFIIITTCWIADTFSYDGIQLNVYNLEGNEFINFFLTAVVEIPGYFLMWFLMGKFGRRWCASGGFIVSGIFCLLPGVVPASQYADIICSMLGKFFCSAAYLSTYQQSSELYPTVVRSQGMGMSSTISKVVAITLPYLLYLSVYGKAIPFTVIGCIAIFAGFLASLLPESLNENLPQTIKDAEEFGKDQKFFSFNRRRRSISKEQTASNAVQLKGVNNLGMMDENIIEKEKTAKEGKLNFAQQEQTMGMKEENRTQSEKPAKEVELNPSQQEQMMTYRHRHSASGAGKDPVRNFEDKSRDNRIRTETDPDVCEQHTEESTNENTEVRL